MTAVSTMIAGSPPWADFAFSGLPAGTVVCRMLRQDPDGRWVLLPGSNQRPILGSEWRFIDHGFPVAVGARTVLYRLEPLSVAGAVLPSPPTVERTYEVTADGSSVEKDGAGTILRRNLATNPYPTANAAGGWLPNNGTINTTANETTLVRRPGTVSRKVTATPSTPASFILTSSLYSVGSVAMLPCAPGEVLTFSVYSMVAERDGHYSTPWVTFHDASRAAVGVKITSTDRVYAQAGVWARASFTFTVPPDASITQLRAYADTLCPPAPVIGLSCYLQDAQVEAGPVATPYFDGKMPTVYGPSQQNGLPFAVQASKVGHSQAWLSDPLDPLAAVLVDVMEEGRRAQWDGAGGGLLPTVGGRPPVSTGFRRWRQRDWAVAVDTPDGAARILGMIEDGGVLLLRGDPECLVHPTGVVYIAADSPELSWMLPHDTHRRYTIGGVECAPPAILQVVASRTYADDLAEHPTHADSKAAYGTYLARVRG